VSDSLRPHELALQASLSFTISWSLLKPMSIESAMPSNHLLLCCPLLLLPSVFPSLRVFSNESAHCIRWPQYWSFSFSIVISFSRIAAWAMEPGRAGLTGSGLAIRKHRSSQGFMGCLNVEVFMKLMCHQRDLGGLFAQGLCLLKCFYFFISDCAAWLLRGLFSSCGEWRLLSGCGASHCGGSSCCRTWDQGTQASRIAARGLSSCGSWALEHRLNSCGAWA